MKTTEKESGNLRMGMMFLSICYIAIGAILLIFPNIALTDLCYALGILFMISGVINVAWYLIKKGYLVPGRFGFAFGVTQVKSLISSVSSLEVTGTVTSRKWSSVTVVLPSVALLSLIHI